MSLGCCKYRKYRKCKNQLRLSWWNDCLLMVPFGLHANNYEDIIFHLCNAIRNKSTQIIDRVDQCLQMFIVHTVSAFDFSCKWSHQFRFTSLFFFSFHFIIFYQFLCEHFSKWMLFPTGSSHNLEAFGKKYSSNFSQLISSFKMYECM